MGKEYHIPKIIKNHAVFKELNIDELTKEELAYGISLILDSELEKDFDAIDHSLVKICSDIIDELTPDSERLSEQELEENLDVIKSSVETQKAVSTHVSRRTVKFRKVLAIAAILVVALSISLSAVAINLGYKNAWELVSQRAIEIFNMNAGDKMDVDGITVINCGKSSVYPSVEDFLEKEKMYIMYPSKLPDGVELERIDVTALGNDNINISFTFNDNSYSFLIQDNLSDFELLSKCEMRRIDGKDYYFTVRDEHYEVLWQYNNYEYALRAPNEADLIEIIENLKENR